MQDLNTTDKTFQKDHNGTKSKAKIPKSMEFKTLKNLYDKKVSKKFLSTQVMSSERISETLYSAEFKNLTNCNVNDKSNSGSEVSQVSIVETKVVI